MLTVIKIFLTVIFGAIYIPMNWTFKKFQKWYLSLYKTDRFLFFVVSPFYWLFVLINSIISVPYEWIADSIH